jgi:hypothetical protein
MTTTQTGKPSPRGLIDSGLEALKEFAPAKKQPQPILS